ncbi:hypothetical protein D8674_017648 [Pyrus ussuriensis x Pyrus communis]|uniref:Reverse transcriptase Ty1/copia-type domain-containing protein n=1 Tax=Pyrus ussuriensis x Pyrus communis TaxID=2448454 RepID=A0A5N5HEB7_9ROSA|nr:hypothetical protein D8674_017648 [Pyrus ussuriensis x Pyrus communis]
MADDRVVVLIMTKTFGLNKSSSLNAQAKIADSAPGFAVLISSGHGSNIQQRAGLAEPKAPIKVGQLSGGIDISDAREKGTASLPSGKTTLGLPNLLADSNHAPDLDPDSIGQQLSLLNLISSREQSDDPSKIDTAFTASAKQYYGWIINSGSTDHMTYDESLFHYLIVPPKDNVITANGEIAPVTGSTAYFTRLLVLKLLNKMVWKNVRTDISWKLHGSPGETETEDLGVMTNPPDCALPEGRDTSIQSPTVGHDIIVQSPVMANDTISQSPMDLDRETPDREIAHATLNSKPTPFIDLAEANLDWPLKQLDVKNVFLHGDLEEEVCMDLPPRYETPNEAGKVCRLQKARYGLKQSPRAWFGRFTEAMKKYSYIQGNVDHTLFIKLIRVSVVSQFMHAPSEDHMAAVMRILSYLKGAPGRGLIFRKHGHLEVKGYIDANCARNINDRHSTSGYFTFVAGNLVTWRSKKQNVVARSTAEVEHRGMAHGIYELLWFRILLTDIGFKPQGAMLLYCDNQAAREIANNLI